MTGLEESLLTGVMLTGLTWGTLKIIWKHAIKGE